MEMGPKGWERSAWRGRRKEDQKWERREGVQVKSAGRRCLLISGR